jgi:DNA-binding IclR family transcriptional regulator
MSTDNAATSTGDDDAYLSPPVQRAARLLRRIAGGDRITNMARTARELAINRTTLLRLLRTLEAERFIEADAERGGYRVGLGLIGLAAQAFFSQDLVQVAVPVADRLAEALGLSAHLGVLDGREVVYVVRRTPNLSAYVSNIRVGSRVPAHAGTMGRIILAHLPPRQVERLYAGQEMPAVTPQTPVTAEALRRRLDEDRAAGLAWSDGFFEPGISSVAAPVFDATGLPVAALNVSGRTADFAGPERREEIDRAVREAAEELSRRLGWHAPSQREDGTKGLKVVA